jgi:hypothetical protein
MFFTKKGSVIVVGAALWLASGAVAAQDRPATPESGASEGGAEAAGRESSEATSRGAGGRRGNAVQSVAIEVRGEIQRPIGFTLSGRSSLGYSYLELPVRFVQEIMNAVRRAPF